MKKFFIIRLLNWRRFNGTSPEVSGLIRISDLDSLFFESKTLPERSRFGSCLRRRIQKTSAVSKRMR